MKSCLAVLPLALLLVPTFAAADEAAQKAKYERTVSKGIQFLTAGQAKDGSYSSQTGIGVTALATNALLQSGVPATDSSVKAGLTYLIGHAKPDWGIYAKGSRHRNYETCLAVLCLSAANENGKYDKLIAGADAFIKGLQWDENEDQSVSDANYGGGGYGKHKRPDLSNTGFLVDALRASGNAENSEAIQKALVFISRCQNLESEHNTTPFAAKINDGGFYYTPSAGGTSQAGEDANGGLRSYGSMTYAGLKSMIYAGVGPEDPRVKAAVKWAQKHYTLETNPGMGDAGLFYYYHLFGKALAATKQDIIKDDQGVEHDWRAELLDELASRQQEDGSWLNDTTRWLEGDKHLVTAYSLLALSYCKPK